MSSAPSGRILAVDAMGGDKGPEAVVQAAAMALSQLEGLEKLILVGQQEILRPLLQGQNLADDPRLEIFHASEVIAMNEKPKVSFQKKKDSSMARTIDLLKEGRCDAAISCGNTGSLVFHATLKLRMMEGVSKPAIGTAIPTRKSFFVLIDAGANPVAKPENLVHNAILGSAYAKLGLGVGNPRVGLLSIGTEEGKGNELTRDSHEQLKAMRGLIQYVGMIEGYQLFEDEVDVAVCDGFVGNIVLKTCESLARMMTRFLKDELTASPLRMAGAALCGGAFKALKSRMNPDRYGGAPLLGLSRTLLKAHGSSNANAWFHAMRIAGEVVSHKLQEHAADDVRRANLLLREIAAKPAPESVALIDKAEG